MKINRLHIEGCCGTSGIVFDIDQPLSKAILPFLTQNDFSISQPFLKAGILYAETKDIAVTAPFGTNKLHIKCKNSNCHNGMNSLEEKLKNFNISDE